MQVVRKGFVKSKTTSKPSGQETIQKKNGKVLQLNSITVYGGQKKCCS